MAQLTASEVLVQIRERIEAEIDESRVEAAGEGGHFEISVIAPGFAGKNRLARQRMVFKVIADLLKGDDAPIHAVDRLETKTPEEAT